MVYMLNVLLCIFTSVSTIILLDRNKKKQMQRSTHFKIKSVLLLIMLDMLFNFSII